MKECKKCHNIKELSEFKKASGMKDGFRSECKVCWAIYQKEYSKTHREQILKTRRKYLEVNRDKIKKYNSEYGKVRNPIYYKNNKAKNLEKTRLWARKNPGKINAKTSKRVADKLKQTPKWANIKAIRQFYINCPEGYEVDHIIPLRGINVRGLHVLNNLQYLTRAENVKKGNKF